MPALSVAAGRHRSPAPWHGRGHEFVTMPALSEWLQLMLAEIARKRDDAERARDEEAQRALDAQAQRAHDGPRGKPKA